jgi:hypothetical protein
LRIFFGYRVANGFVLLAAGTRYGRAVASAFFADVTISGCACLLNIRELRPFKRLASICRASPTMKKMARISIF